MHTVKTAEYIISREALAGLSEELILPLEIAAQWHDIGKLFTKKIDGNGFNTYIGHPDKSAEIFERNYIGESKDIISFFIKNHDVFLFYSINDLTDEMIKRIMQKIQGETRFKITADHWKALALLMEADESAKNPLVVIHGRVVRTLEDDMNKVSLIKRIMIKNSEA